MCPMGLYYLYMYTIHAMFMYDYILQNLFGASTSEVFNIFQYRMFYLMYESTVQLKENLSNSITVYFTDTHHLNIFACSGPDCGGGNVTSDVPGWGGDHPRAAAAQGGAASAEGVEGTTDTAAQVRHMG